MVGLIEFRKAIAGLSADPAADRVLVISNDVLNIIKVHGKARLSFEDNQYFYDVPYYGKTRLIIEVAI